MMMIKRLLFTLLITITLTTDHCEIVTPNTEIFITSNELKTLHLNSVIKGYDLSFQVNDPDISLYSAYEVTNKAALNLGEYTLLNSFDVRSSKGVFGMGNAALLVQKQNYQEIGIWMGVFQGDNSLPTIDALKVFKLPSNLKAKCFDFKLTDGKGDAGFLNCQTITDNPKEEVTKDIFCYIKANDTILSFDTNCIAYPTKSNTLCRKTSVLTIQSQLYFISSSKAITDDLKSINYMEIYALNEKNIIQLKTQITQFQLLKRKFEIVDVVVTNSNQIIVADALQARLVYLNYIDGEVQIDKEVFLGSKPLDIFYLSELNHLFLATELAITEHQADNPGKIVAKYEVDPSDAQITNIQASDSLVMFITSNGNLNIYQRNEYKINYLLYKRATSIYTSFLLSQKKNIIFSLTNKNIESIVIAPAYIEINNVSAKKSVKIIAKSVIETCQASLTLTYLEKSSQIINKKDIQKKLFKVNPSQDLNIKLNEYFAGANLMYQLDQNAINNKDFDITLSHVGTYDFVQTFPTAEAQALVNIDEKSFYFVGVNTIKESHAYIDICSLDNGQISCKAYGSAILLNNKRSIATIKGAKTASGEYYVGWSYKYSGVFQCLNIKDKTSVSYFDQGYPIQISNILFTTNYQLIISKGIRRISLSFSKQPFIVSLNEQSFTQKELVELQYFYAREAYVDSMNQNVFYVKLPTRVAKFVITESQEVKYQGIVLDFGEFIPDKEWSLVFKGNKAITQRGKMIDQWYFNEVKKAFVKLVSLTSDNIVEPLHYDSQSNLATIVQAKPDSNNLKNIKIIKPFTSAIDTEYYQFQIQGDLQISKNWMFIKDQQTYKVVYLYSDPVLSVISHLDDDSFKADLSIQIVVKNQQESQTIITNIEAVNFPIRIKETPSANMVSFPSDAANQMEIRIPAQMYFNGSITDYQLSCPMCGGSRIHLDEPLRLNSSIQDIPAVLDFVTVSPTRVIAVTSNILLLMNTNGQIINKFPLRIQYGICSNLQYNKNLDLLVYCSSETTQYILRYFVNNDKFVYADRYDLEGQSMIANFDEMFAVTVGQKTYLFILDNDEMKDNMDKKSVLKLFNVGKEFFYMGTWDSTTFGTDELYPINDFEVKEGLLMVTLGTYGLGYGNLDEQFILINSGNIQLSSVPQIKAITLEDSFFKQVEILLPLQNQAISIFLTTTNSFSMVLQLQKQDKSYSFSKITETYFRYGALRLLNWQTITKDSIFLSYYNSALQQVDIVYYKRKVGAKTHFIDSATARITQNQVKYHEALVTDDNNLLTSHLSDDLTVGEISVYGIFNYFSLRLNYSQPQISMDHIDILAFNYYSQANHTQKVKFTKPDPNPESNSLKWYIIVIIVACIFIAIGVGYGLYLYRKKQRAQKNVSLLTERQEDQNESGQSKVEKKETEVKQAGLNRTSINADEQ